MGLYPTDIADHLDSRASNAVRVMDAGVVVVVLEAVFVVVGSDNDVMARHCRIH